MMLANKEVPVPIATFPLACKALKFGPLIVVAKLDPFSKVTPPAVKVPVGFPGATVPNTSKAFVVPVPLMVAPALTSVVVVLPTMFR